MSSSVTFPEEHSRRQRRATANYECRHGYTVEHAESSFLMWENVRPALLDRSHVDGLEKPTLAPNA